MKKSISIIAFVTALVLTGCGAGNGELDEKAIIKVTDVTEELINTEKKENLSVKHVVKEYKGISSANSDMEAVAADFIENFDSIEALEAGNIPCSSDEKYENNDRTYYKSQDTRFNCSMDVKNYLRAYIAEPVFQFRYDDLLNSDSVYADYNGELYVCKSENQTGYDWLDKPRITENGERSYQIQADFNNSEEISTMILDIKDYEGVWKIDSIYVDYHEYNSQLKSDPYAWIGTWSSYQASVTVSDNEDGTFSVYGKLEDGKLKNNEWNYICVYDEESDSLVSISGEILNPLIIQSSTDLTESSDLSEEASFHFDAYGFWWNNLSSGINICMQKSEE